MCGIVGYIGKQQAFEILIKGLTQLEYRGYDSAGVALLNGKLSTHKKKGKVAELAKIEEAKNNNSTVGIGHTRWATHGIPNEVNAHPHLSQSENIALVHNGIIENYDIIKQDLISKGVKFKSQTDTEVLVQLIEHILSEDKVPLDEAIRKALKKVKGSYAIVVVAKEHPNTIIVAKKSSPLAIGVGNDEFFISSDAIPIVNYTKQIIYLEDEEIAIISSDKPIKIKNLDNEEKTIKIQTVDIQVDALEKGGFEHFMLKEIFEQPKSIENAIKFFKHEEIENNLEKFLNVKRVLFVACGTSWHAGLVGEHLFENITKIPCKVEYASEFRYREPIINKDDMVIVLSQSGETADTLAAVELAKEKGSFVLGVCNAIGATIPRLVDVCFYTYAGPEISVASTKAFTTQITVLTQIALHLAKCKNVILETEFNEKRSQLETVPQLVNKALSQNELIKKIAIKYKEATDAIYLGRNFCFPLALEGALKLKEISYIHAEGFPSAEMKHGPIALIDEKMPVIIIAPQNNLYEKTISNMQEVKARGGRIISVVTEGDITANNLSEDCIEIPKSADFITPIIASIPLQLLAYHTALSKGCNVDQPRNLAKSVTVE